MPAVSWRHWRSSAVLALALCAAATQAAPAETIAVAADQARVMRLPAGTATVVIGNPLIADATLQSGGVLVLTGKGYGKTNLLALDRSGRVLLDAGVEVKTPHGADLVVVYRGMERQSYSCAPECAPRMTLGDSTDYFDKTQKQIVSRIGQPGSNQPPR